MTKNQITVTLPNPITISQAGALAQSHIRQNVFDLAFERLSTNTIKSRQQAAELWCAFLADIGVDTLDMDCATDPAAWSGVTAALLEAFQRWMLQSGYSINTINQRFSSVRWYCRLAARAGVVAGDELAKIESIALIRHGEGIELDKKRGVSRVGRKKGKSTVLNQYQVAKLKSIPGNDPQSIRDRLLMCLMLDHALRVSEVIALTVEDIDIQTGMMKFWRPKIKQWHTHRLTDSTLTTLGDYLACPNAPTTGRLLKATGRGKQLVASGSCYIGKTAIDKIVRSYGAGLGLPALSAHDLRHSAASRAASGGTDLRSLMGLGGWASAGTAERYLDDLTVHNEGVKGVD